MAKYYSESDTRKWLYQESGNPVATLYGQTVADPSRSVQPFVATPIDYSSVSISWKIPLAQNRRFRLTRNQDGIPDSSEEGVVLIDSWENSLSSWLDDGSTVPLVPGKHVYYSIWIWLSSGNDNTEWYLCGTAQTVVPTNHSKTIDGNDSPTTHQRLMDLLPKVLATGGWIDDPNSNLTPPKRVWVEPDSLGVVDYTSDISKFLSAMAFTADEVMTYADLLIPNSDFTSLTPDLLNAVGYNYGLQSENRLSTANQKHLIREIMRIYREKGTISGLSTFVESSTGFNTGIITSPNIMLSAADSTFYQGVGNWTTNGAAGITLESVTGAVPDVPAALASEVARRTDNSYVGKIVTSGTNKIISLGNSDVAKTAIPVTAGEYYTFSLYQKKSATAATYTLTVTWYDYLGNAISPQASSSALDSTTAWSKIYFDNVIAPTNAAYAGLSVTFSASGTYYLDMLQFSTSDIATYDIDGKAIYEYFDARGVSISLEPNKVNYITNPSFETNASNWTALNGALTKVALVGSGLPGIIPGQYSGSYAAQCTSSTDAAVSLSTISEQTLSQGSDYTFSAHVDSPVVPTGGYTGSIEVYAVNPYSNFVLKPTPASSGDATGWTFSPGTGGVASTSYETNLADRACVKYSVTTAPTNGDMIFNLGKTGISQITTAGTTQSIHESAEYVLRAWVYSNKVVEVIPTTIWGYIGNILQVTDVSRTSGDNVVTLTATGAGAKYSVGDTIIVSETTDETVNGTWVVTAKTTDSVSYASGDTTAVSLTGITGMVGTPETTLEDNSPATIAADTWTQLEWTSIAPFESTDVSFTISCDALGFTISDFMAFSNAEVGYMTYSATSNWTGVNDTWGRHSTSIVLPRDIVLPYDKNGLSAKMSISYTSNGNNVFVDAVQLEPRYIATDYFDGSFVDAKWDGTAHASVSKFYTNIDAKLARLRQEITKYIPLGIPYYVTVNNSIALSGTFKGYA